MATQHCQRQGCSRSGLPVSAWPYTTQHTSCAHSEVSVHSPSLAPKVSSRRGKQGASRLWLWIQLCSPLGEWLLC